MLTRVRTNHIETLEITSELQEDTEFLRKLIILEQILKARFDLKAFLSRFLPFKRISYLQPLKKFKTANSSSN
jgi:hypothetical protein